MTAEDALTGRAAAPSRPGHLPQGNAIEVRDLVKRYRGASANAVDGVSFDVADGQLFCLLGPNGAGKTTTVSILTTALSPTSGEVLVGGRRPAADPAAVRRDIGVVFQQPSLDLNLTAEENVRVHAVLYGLHPWRPAFRLMPAAYRRQVHDLAAMLGLTGTLGLPARALSGGMRRKLEIVRALLHQPRVLFLDEPTAGLDPESRRSLWSYLSDSRARRGTTIVLTTHYLEEAEAADSVCIMAHGRLVERGTPAEVKARHTAPVLVLDAVDQAGLRRELAALGLEVTGGPETAGGPETSGGPAATGGPEVAAGPALRVALAGHSAHEILRSVASELTHIRIVEPSLEEAYLMLLARSAP